MPAPHAPLVTPCRSPLGQLLHELRGIGDLRRRPAEVAALLHSLPPPLASILPALRFPRRGYARTLVYRDAELELLLLAWSAGSASPVHDHDGQDCWFVPLAGTFALDDYQIVDGLGVKGVDARGGDACPIVGGADRRHGDRDLFAGRARLAPLRSRRLGRGELDRRDEHEAVHAVTPLSPRALSLHVYARPLDRCRIFDLARACWSWMHLGYDSRAPLLGE